MNENERMERQERAWIGLTVAICIGLLMGSMFLLSLYFRVPLPV